ncbi:SDR family NAD(P)-dependent oxidoreductase [Rhodococcus sp. NPDC056960]|uniref:SDR family NAD(P)-dependent oxidoreductase n=1 Tax=Rhodococcus TaxID=1827 RepID=UPI003636EE6C
MEIVKDMSAVVTGAGGGMGRSIALALADAGVNVVVADIDADAARIVGKEVAERGVKSIAVATDVSKFEQVQALAERAYSEFGSIEILCNNAGVTLRPFRASWDTSLEDYEWIMGINFKGVLHGHLAFVPRMRETPGKKHIVNTSSLATVVLASGHSAYNASKAAVDAFSITARKELAAQDIGVTLLHPGAVRTRIVTSERLRPVEEQSETRYVKPWSDYNSPGGNPLADKKPDQVEEPVNDPDTTDDVFTYITPKATGWLVLEAIRQNKQHIMTHPVPNQVQQGNADAIKAGNPNYSAFPGSK